MTEPTTVNVGYIIPNTGDLPGTWGTAALNPDFVALDGYQGGVQTISVSGSPITLTAPAGFTPTPGPGPTQAQNAVLRFTGTQTGNVTITLPTPGYYIVENSCTGNVGYLLIMASGITAGEYIVIDRGMRQHIYYDGANVRFVNLGVVGQMELWVAYSAIPAWVSTCALPPYLLCDGSVYNYSTYPVLANRLGGTFGGNGITTFGVPDLRGRVPLAYDGTGGRITANISGISGTTLGSAGGDQSVGAHYHSVSLTTSGMSGNDPHTHSYLQFSSGYGAAGGGPQAAGNNVGATTGSTSIAHTHSVNGNTNYNASYGAGANIPPAQVVGIWVIRAA